MSVKLHLELEVEQRLREEARRSGESLDSVANRLIRSAPLSPENEIVPFVVAPMDLGIREQWPELTASEILSKLDLEEYEEKLERTRHQPSPLRL